MNEKRTHRRWRLFADMKLQGSLLLRTAFYWMGCQALMVCTVLAFQWLTEDTSNAWDLMIPGIVVTSLCLPIVLFDLIVFSNRYAGPMLQISRWINGNADGKSVKGVRFREGDFFPGLDEKLNKINSMLHEDNVAHDEQREISSTTTTSV